MLEFNKLMTQVYMLAEYGSDRTAAVTFLRRALAKSPEILSEAKAWRARFDDPDQRGSQFQHIMYGILAEACGLPLSEIPPRAFIDAAPP